MHTRVQHTTASPSFCLAGTKAFMNTRQPYPQHSKPVSITKPAHNMTGHSSSCGCHGRGPTANCQRNIKVTSRGSSSTGRGCIGWRRRWTASTTYRGSRPEEKIPRTPAKTFNRGFTAQPIIRLGESRRPSVGREESPEQAGGRAVQGLLGHSSGQEGRRRWWHQKQQPSCASKRTYRGSVAVARMNAVDKFWSAVVSSRPKFPVFIYLFISAGGDTIYP